ncbi:hypothetical protein [Bacillus sp. FSL P2-0092]|uniref:hypothetical protein n=1 Tax=Bacillus sp. FSL P2-0092 TaxID=2921571 RepID=UPI0030F8B28A
MENGYFVIAGKIEGFDHRNANFLWCEDETDVEALINLLRDEGYKIFYVTKIIDRIDDFLTKEGAE